MIAPTTRDEMEQVIRTSCGDDADSILADLSEMDDAEVADCCTALAGMLTMDALRDPTDI
jgi:hypothetical protein